MANSFGTVNDNARWRERVRKEAEILARAKPTEFRLNVKTVSAYPTPPQHLNPSLNTSQVSFDVFAKYDLNGDGIMSVTELRGAFQDLGINMSDEAITELQKELDTNNDGVVSIAELQEFWNKKVRTMKDILTRDPTATWGPVPQATSQEVGWFVAREPDTYKMRRANQMKWRYPKDSCPETLYATEFVKFAGASPYSNKGRPPN